VVTARITFDLLFLLNLQNQCYTTSKKLATLEYLLTLLESFIKERTIQEFSKTISPAMVNNMLKATKRNKSKKDSKTGRLERA